jgi:hypothetical protein
MWFFAIVAGVVIVIMTGLLAGRARRAGRPALGSFAERAGLPVLGASIFIALGLAQHDAAWTLAGLLLVYAAGYMTSSVAENLAGRARRAGRPALGGLARAAGLPVFGASIFIAFGLALHHVDWMTLALLLLVYAVYAIWHTLRHRRTNI